MKSNRLLKLLLIPVLLLMVPLIAMQFSEEVNWSSFDFIVAGILLFGTAIIAELIFRRIKNQRSRILGILVLLFILVFVWAELAVGIIGSPLSGN